MAEENNKLHIRLHLYDTDLAVNVPREDEMFYRQAADLINTTVNTYAKVYKGRKTDKELLYMSMIDIALHYAQLREKNDTAPFSDVLVKLTREIEDALK